MRNSILLALFAGLLGTGARAGTIVSAQTGVVMPSGSGVFDVTLTNTGTSSIVVGAFSFGISVSNPDISFTDVTTASGKYGYIFGADSLFGPDLTGPISGTTLEASDVFDIPNSGAVVAAGSTVELGEVTFMVAPGSALGSYTSMLLADPYTSLSDAAGNSIMVDMLSNGTIQVSSAPECSSLLMLAGGMSLVWLKVRRQRS